MIRLRRAWLAGGIVLGSATLVIPLAVLSGSANAAPSGAAKPAGYQTQFGSAHRLIQAASISSLPHIASSFRNEGPRVLSPVRPTHPSTLGAPDAASAGATPLGFFSGVSRAFNGVDDLNNVPLIGGEVTPPDQGLCIGRDNTLPFGPEVVFEPVNETSRETDTSGNPLRPDVSLATLFQDPYASGDVRCVYDARSQTFIFTEIGFPVATGPANTSPLPFNTVDDVLVLNRNGVAAYQFDSSQGGTAFGDQPKVGFDNNALVISTDEYTGAQETEIGAIATVISLPQLVAEASTVNEATLGPVSLAGDPVVGLDPAINTGSGTAYFVNSDPFLANGNNNPVGNVLGLWTLTNSAAVTNGFGTITLSSVVLPSEPYAFPVPATSTGTGNVTTVGGLPITSEAALNPDDSRITEPVQVTHDLLGGIDLWATLDAAVTPAGDTTARDGAAWFKVTVGNLFGGSGASIARQGYVSADGAYLLYPALGVPQFGSPDMVFTITSKTINPSAAYTVLGSGKITTEAAGAAAHVSFSDVLFAEPRWGDYSWAQVDPNGSGVWMATEYIPPATDQDPLDNWGTYVFKVNNFSFNF
ncbi:MAG TPA: hypothetical protein VIX15_04270 [Streptosporangiaceae bacterium]